MRKLMMAAAIAMLPFAAAAADQKLDGTYRLVSDGMENLVQRHLVVALAEKVRVPALYPYRIFVGIGGLMAYAGEELTHRVIEDVDMILKGKKPGEIPIYQASRFTTIVNLKTAKALGLTIPPTLLARADEVIE